jgi:geranylgeranyl diphosphate synthase type I
MHDLKTGHYTIRGPLALGHAAAQGTPAAWEALQAYARPLGIAYQLRDDLLGVFGEAAFTGKGAASDVRNGKRTAPIQVAMARLHPAGRAELESLLAAAAPTVMDRVRALLRSVDAEAAVNTRIDALCAQALQQLETAVIRVQGRQLLARLAELISQRQY